MKKIIFAQITKRKILIHANHISLRKMKCSEQSYLNIT